MRYKVWRSNKDKQLHLISAEGSEASRPCRQQLRIWGLGRDRRKVIWGIYGFRFAHCWSIRVS